MLGYSQTASSIPWWKEPTKDQWYAYCAAWMGWTLDAFDFTVFLLIMAPIAQEFGVPLIDVTAVFSVTLIMRLAGATASGWLADRMGRRAPLMISILWYSVCNFAAIFKPRYLFNTLTGCVWMGANFCVYYAIWAILGTYLQKELHWTPAQVAVPVFWGNIITFFACSFWGALSERIGRRWALMIPCSLAIVLVPLYLTTTDPSWFLGLFLLTICFVGGKDALNPGWLSERFPTEVRATAAGFVYHQGAVWGAAVAPLLTYYAVNQQMGFAKPMLYGTVGSLIVYVIAVYLGPETKGKVMTSELEVVEAVAPV